MTFNTTNPGVPPAPPSTTPDNDSSARLPLFPLVQGVYSLVRTTHCCHWSTCRCSVSSPLHLSARDQPGRLSGRSFNPPWGDRTIILVLTRQPSSMVSTARLLASLFLVRNTQNFTAEGTRAVQPAAVPASGPAAAGARPQPWDIPSNRPLGPSDSLASIERTGAQVSVPPRSLWCLYTLKWLARPWHLLFCGCHALILRICQLRLASQAGQDAFLARRTMVLMSRKRLALPSFPENS